MRHGSQRRQGSIRKTVRIKQIARPRPVAFGFEAEPLERRVMLSNAVRAAIPARIDPAAQPQTLFVPGGDAIALNLPQGGGPVVSYYRFAVNNAAPGQLTTFSTSSPSPTLVDTAFALYDSDGNLLKISDTDSPA